MKDITLLESTNVNIWGTNLAVNPSCLHWKGINLLGANYLRKASLNFQCIYDNEFRNEYCMLEKKETELK